jgi:hypothetical protein
MVFLDVGVRHGSPSDVGGGSMRNQTTRPKLHCRSVTAFLTWFKAGLRCYPRLGLFSVPGPPSVPEEASGGGSSNMHSTTLASSDPPAERNV